MKKHCCVKLSDGSTCPQPRANNQSRCIDHNADYQRNYRGTIMSVAERRGFARGVEAMRALLAMDFGRLGNAVLSGHDIQAVIMTSIKPEWDKPIPAVTGTESLRART